MKSLQHEHLEFHNRIVRRAVFLGTARTSCGLFEGRPEPFEINRSGQLFKRIPVGRYLIHNFLKVAKANLITHPALQCCQFP